MAYTLKRKGQVLFHAECDKCPYSPEIEAQMQESGHEIYVNGKKLRKVKKNGA